MVESEYCCFPLSMSHCLENAQIRGFFWSVFFSYSYLMWGFTTESSVFSPNTGNCGPERTPYLDPFHAVSTILTPRGQCGQYCSLLNESDCKCFVR